MRVLLLLLIPLTGCVGPDFRTEHLDLALTMPDGASRRLKIDDWAAIEATTLGISAGWPHVAAMTAEESASRATPWFVVDFLPYYPAVTEASSAWIQPGDGQAYSNERSGGVTVTVDRIAFTRDRSFPWVHEGRLSGVVGGVGIEGTFTVSEPNCNHDIYRSEGCGGHWIDPDVDEQTYSIPGFARDTCPAEIRDRYLDGTTVTFRRDEAWSGSASSFPCLDVGKGNEGVTYSGSEKWEAGPYLCGLTDEVTVDGCTWSVHVWAQPGYLQEARFWVRAGVVDGSCEPTWCETSATELFAQP